MTPKFFDAHTHLDMLDDDPRSIGASWREVGERTIEEGIWLVNVGADEESSRLAVEQAHELGEGCWATVGIHPTEDNGSDFEVIKKLAKDDKVVAIGECGLEYYRVEDEELKAKQCELFIKHIGLAIEVDKPLMIHCRSSDPKTSTGGINDAYLGILEILKGYKDKIRFNMHFFAGDWPLAQEFLALGGNLSFSGVITFSDQYDEIIKRMPLACLMSETDAPFASPVPYRGQRNEPAYVQYVARRICELRSEPEEEVLTALVQNAQKFFDIGLNS